VIRQRLGMLADDLLARLAVKVSQTSVSMFAIQERLSEFLALPPGRALVARTARSEVKDYLAELAEEADMPFPGPMGFLANVKLNLGLIASTNLKREPEDPYDPAEDSPFAVIDPESIVITESKPRDHELEAQLHIVKGDN
jgi:hypothetical protein